MVKDAPAKELDVPEITRWMVGRNVETSATAADVRSHDEARNIMSIRRLWVDMPGETVRDVSLDIK